MDTTEGGALVEDNRSSGVGERQGLGVSEPRNDLSIKVWEQYDLFQGKKGNVEGVWSKCKWCNNIYGTNITRLMQHFTCDFSFKNWSMPELRAYKKEGSNKHIRGCSSVPEKLKLQIRELDARQRGKAVLLATQEEASRALREPVDEEEAMAQAWWEEQESRRTNWNGAGQNQRNQFNTRSSRQPI
ncbi:hypothetical protein R1flu_009205 [Riccia fluitans]|uniref:BED-type domain-containing protein n=1 Tax=Riccia fluitans TaxID=41844 RepID=A0ABD1Z1K7_9MARC